MAGGVPKPLEVPVQTHHQLILAVGAMAMLTFAVGLRMVRDRVAEMRAQRIHPQSVPTSSQLYARLQDIRSADNYRNLFEVPILFYALCALALANPPVPGWLAVGAWAFVAIRTAHSVVQCTYNKVMHRFPLFLASFLLLAVLWVAWLWSVWAGAAAGA